jgi:hypothetical protein
VQCGEYPTPAVALRFTGDSCAFMHAFFGSFQYDQSARPLACSFRVTYHGERPDEYFSGKGLTRNHSIPVRLSVTLYYKANMVALLQPGHTWPCPPEVMAPFLSPPPLAANKTMLLYGEDQGPAVSLLLCC